MHNRVKYYLLDILDEHSGESDFPLHLRKPLSQMNDIEISTLWIYGTVKDGQEINNKKELAIRNKYRNKRILP